MRDEFDDHPLVGYPSTNPNDKNDKADAKSTAKNAGIQQFRDMPS